MNHEHCQRQKLKEAHEHIEHLEGIIYKLWLYTRPKNQTQNQERHLIMSTKTAAQQAQEIQDAYNQQTVLIGQDQKTIDDLQAQIASGTPVTQDQLDALKINSVTADEVEAAQAALNPPATAPDPVSTPPAVDPATPTPVDPTAASSQS